MKAAIGLSRQPETWWHGHSCVEITKVSCTLVAEGSPEPVARELTCQQVSFSNTPGEGHSAVCSDSGADLHTINPAVETIRHLEEVGKTGIFAEFFICYLRHVTSILPFGVWPRHNIPSHALASERCGINQIGNIQRNWEYVYICYWRFRLSYVIIWVLKNLLRNLLRNTVGKLSVKVLLFSIVSKTVIPLTTTKMWPDSTSMVLQACDHSWGLSFSSWPVLEKKATTEMCNADCMEFFEYVLVVYG